MSTVDAEALRVRRAARALAAEHGFRTVPAALAGTCAGSRFLTRPFGPELGDLLEKYPVLSWVDEHLPEILTRAGVGGVE
ncbi:hypothetical protein [Mycolicibacter virginiensis]|uniref:hypothetical protein n=1 Tax=Mycolicibacter virginiensis TaxID=1795032 RepID=UPI001F04C10D|nr:hypothetical protein [Mycolicibacter virginiensis]ULP48056.1 hypothetical protein MJO54_02470 [Mycolicibacter virginiensis]